MREEEEGGRRMTPVCVSVFLACVSQRRCVFWTQSSREAIIWFLCLCVCVFFWLAMKIMPEREKKRQKSALLLLAGRWVAIEEEEEEEMRQAMMGCDVM